MIFFIKGGSYIEEDMMRIKPSNLVPFFSVFYFKEMVCPVNSEKLKLQQSIFLFHIFLVNVHVLTKSIHSRMYRLGCIFTLQGCLVSIK